MGNSYRFVSVLRGCRGVVANHRSSMFPALLSIYLSLFDDVRSRLAGREARSAGETVSQRRDLMLPGINVNDMVRDADAHPCVRIMGQDHSV